MSTFLFTIGAYNLVGAIVLAAMLADPVLDLVLRRLTEVATAPVAHGPWSRLWLGWAAAVNLFLGFVMLRAAAWPAALQREVTAAALAVYLLMTALLVAGARRPGLGRGLWITLALWLAQLGWGAWALRG